MKSDINLIIREIINKKFDKSHGAGYNSLEVDMFFDKMKNFIWTLYEEIEKKNVIITTKNVEIDELKRKNKELEKAYQNIVDKYNLLHKDGFNNVYYMNAISQLTYDLNSLKEKVSKNNENDK